MKKVIWPIGDWAQFAFGKSRMVASRSVFLIVWTYDNGYMPAMLGAALIPALGYSIISNRDLIRGRLS